jgi:putative membrane protein
VTGSPNSAKRVPPGSDPPGPGTCPAEVSAGSASLEVVNQSAPVPPPEEPAAPPVEGAPQPAKGTERPHPLTPLIRGWLVLAAGLAYLAQDFLPFGRQPQESRPPLWILAVAIAAFAILGGVGGWLTWWFTRFVIDDEEIRVETGVLNKRSRKVGFGRIQSVDVIQPLLARIFDLGELRIEAGGGDSGITLRYLKRDKAYQLRDYLLSRAHGHQTSLAESSGRPQAGRFEDLSTADRVLVRIEPQQLIIGLLTSLDFIISVLVLLTVIVISWGLGWGLIALGGILPFAMGVLGMISRRVITQFNYTLAESGGVRPGEPTGLRIARGLTNLTSQSVPLDRIQGVRITQSWLWRKLRLHRVDIDVLGYDSTEQDNSKSGSSMLFPVATTEQVRLAMAYLLPDAQDEQVELTPVSRRAAWLRPLSFRTLRWGWNDRVIVSEGGLLVFVRDTVPHAKTQSVRLSQGPLQRHLDLASVHVDTTPGPVHFTIPHLTPETARSVFDTQLPRAADARRTATTTPRTPAGPQLTLDSAPSQVPEEDHDQPGPDPDPAQWRRNAPGGPWHLADERRRD